MSRSRSSCAPDGPGSPREQVGLTSHTRRRVPGLRRGEVADLAGVSVEYYAQLERGHLNGVSGEVLDAVARALQLDEAEHAHLLDLVRAAGPAPRTRRRPAHQVRPTVARILDGMTDLPALVNNGRLDILAANPLARALFSRCTRTRPDRRTSPGSTSWTPTPGSSGRTGNAPPTTPSPCCAPHAGRDPYDRALTDLIGELSTRSDEFRVRWAAHDVRVHRTGIKRIHHPIVGDLHLPYEVLDLPADPGQALVVYTADPDTPSHDALRLLASWAATHHPVDTVTSLPPA